MAHTLILPSAMVLTATCLLLVHLVDGMRLIVRHLKLLVENILCNTSMLSSILQNEVKYEECVRRLEAQIRALRSDRAELRGAVTRLSTRKIELFEFARQCVVMEQRLQAAIQEAKSSRRNVQRSLLNTRMRLIEVMVDKTHDEESTHSSSISAQKQHYSTVFEQPTCESESERGEETIASSIAEKTGSKTFYYEFMFSITPSVSCSGGDIDSFGTLKKTIVSKIDHAGSR